jgi:eukaryotic-like serine/threonine-protein kinase
MGTRLSYQTRLFTLAADGTLIYVPAATGPEAASFLTWVDRSGRETPIGQFDRPADIPRLSRDGTRIAFRAPATNCDIWVHDIGRGTTMRLTREGDNHGVVWTPDGTRLATARSTPDRTDILVLSADGSGATEHFAQFDDFGATPTSWSPAGALLVQVSLAPTTNAHIYSVMPKQGAIPLVESPFNASNAVFSPDGRLVAYVSDETGRTEIYVRSASGEGSRVQVSSQGGLEPVWSPTGRELFFRNGRDFLSVGVEASPLRVPGRPERLFAADYPFGPLTANHDVSPDGRFVVIKSRQWQDQPVVVLNWFSEWKPPGGDPVRRMRIP